jgi:hypothetical protein
MTITINLDTPAVCYLRITTWAGSRVCSAQHWYGTLSCGPRPRGEHDVQYILSQADADRLNNSDGDYRAGEESGRFFSKDALIEAALACWQQHFPKARLLIEGTADTLEPQPVLAGSPDIAARINQLWRECEELGWWDGDASAGEACEARSDVWLGIWKTEIEPLALS